MLSSNLTNNLENDIGIYVNFFFFFIDFGVFFPNTTPNLFCQVHIRYPLAIALNRFGLLYLLTLFPHPCRILLLSVSRAAICSWRCICSLPKKTPFFGSQLFLLTSLQNKKLLPQQPRFYVVTILTIK